MAIHANQKKIADLLVRRTETIIEKERLKKKLLLGKKLRIKHGVDPTGPTIHLGRAIPLWKLREFQDLGHQIVLIIGDFTAQVGDPSDKDASRPMLTAGQIKENMRAYQKQISLILDPDQTEWHYNSEWLHKLSFLDGIKLMTHFTAQQMLERERFVKRLRQEKPLYLHELTYPVLQAYDSIAIKADVEVGGRDQLFNLMAGRILQKGVGQKPQDILTTEWLLGPDGRKMSTSWGNVISLTDAPHDLYGKLMSVRDELIIDYFRLCTNLPLARIHEYKKELQAGTNPMQIKKVLAKEITQLYHGTKKAHQAEEEFARVIQRGRAPKSQVPLFTTSQKAWELASLCLASGAASSISEAKRVIKQKGLSVDGQALTDSSCQITLNSKKDLLLKRGKLRYYQIRLVK